MFGRKKHQKKIHAFAVEWQQKFAAKKAEIDKLKEIPDAGDRYTALAELEAAVKTEWLASVKALDITFNKGITWSMAGGTTLSVLCSMAAAGIVAGFPPLLGIAPLLMGYGGGIGLAVLRNQRNNDTAKELEETAQMQLSFSNDVKAAQNDILARDLNTLARSSNFGALCDKYPDVKDAFVKAATNSGFAADVLPHDLTKNRLPPPKP